MFQQGDFLMLKSKIASVGIIGAAGYAGVELLRLLLHHPYVKLDAISSVSFEGQNICDVYPNLNKLCSLNFENADSVINKCDIIFAALPAKLSEVFAQKCDELNKIFIDLGADFRLENENDYINWYSGKYINKELHKKAVYGLPELFRNKIKTARLIANPGCYTTAVELALVPAIQKDLILTDTIIADCKSGATGAGKSLSNNTHFSQLNESLHPYKIASHRHIPEIDQILSKFCNNKINITFVPHLLPINRGVLATCYAKLKHHMDLKSIKDVFEHFYKDEYFIRLLSNDSYADIHNVKYSNFCDISLHIDNRTNTLIIVSAIDNMVKGAAGQAIQNMNIILNFEESAGLNIIPPAF